MNTPPATGQGMAVFPATQWSVVLKAGRATPQSAEALEKLCRAYWPPMYAYVRRFGHSPHDAQDITQEFFARLLAGEWLGKADREKGRFRTFLLTALKRFMIGEWERACAQKRGSGMQAICFDTELGERLYNSGAEGCSPDRAYDYNYALTLLRTSLQELKDQFAAEGKESDFEAMKPYLTASHGEIPYEELAKRLERDPGSARVAVHRFRKRYREIFRSQVARTVARPEEIEDELRCLMDVLSTGNQSTFPE